MILLDSENIFCYHLETTKSSIRALTKGIDSSQLQLLCVSSNANIPLDDILWSSIFKPSLSIPNPYVVNTTLSNGINSLRCNRGSDSPFSYVIIIQGNLLNTLNKNAFERVFILNSIFCL